MSTVLQRDSKRPSALPIARLRLVLAVPCNAAQHLLEPRCYLGAASAASQLTGISRSRPCPFPATFPSPRCPFWDAQSVAGDVSVPRCPLPTFPVPPVCFWPPNSQPATFGPQLSVSGAAQSVRRRFWSRCPFPGPRCPLKARRRRAWGAVSSQGIRLRQRVGRSQRIVHRAQKLL